VSTRFQHQQLTPTRTVLLPHLALLPGALNDYQKDLQFRKLNAQKDVIDIKVIRGGKTVLIKNSEAVVGDVLILDTGERGAGAVQHHPSLWEPAQMQHRAFLLGLSHSVQAWEG